MLHNGDLDIAFIPSIEYLRSDYLLIPDHSISSKGKVDSVLLLSKKDITDLTSVAIDMRSKTSVAMLKILLNKKYKINPDMVYMQPDIIKMMKRCDSALIIGDQALGINSAVYRVYDLGEEWYSYTQTIFVHAVLAVRPDVNLGDSINTLISSKEMGLANIDRIAEYSDLDYRKCLEYLTNTISYDLGREEIMGLKCFYSLAAECGITKGNDEIRTYNKIPSG